MGTPEEIQFFNPKVGIQQPPTSFKIVQSNLRFPLSYDFYWQGGISGLVLHQYKMYNGMRRWRESTANPGVHFVLVNQVFGWLLFVAPDSLFLANSWEVVL
jgi:hypothetical protein